MRNSLRAVFDSAGAPDHLALAYDAWAPVGPGGKVPDEKDERSRWLMQLAGLRIAPDYAKAFQRWQSSFRQPGDRVFELQLASRLLVGHGNASATDVGLTVHHTWGVPVIPGTSLKGLLSHYVDAVYGPENPDLPPWEQPEGLERERARYRGVVWDTDTHKRRILQGPGESHRALFGAPEADMDEEWRKHRLTAGATKGLVVFHDALYVPGSADRDQPFATDVLTVHQGTYYKSSDKNWPNDYESPNPVAFVTVRPRVRMLFALSGWPELTEFAERLLVDALRDWGVGGKSSAGYGRLVGADRGTGNRAQPRHQPREQITVTRVDDPTGRGKVRFQADDGIIGHFAGEAPPTVPIGETVAVWVANVAVHAYTFTLKPPKAAKR